MSFGLCASAKVLVLRFDFFLGDAGTMPEHPGRAPCNRRFACRVCARDVSLC